MIALVYVAVLLGSVTVLAVAVLRPRRPAPVAETALVAPLLELVRDDDGTAEADVRTILLAASRLAERLAPAA